MTPRKMVTPWMLEVLGIIVRGNEDGSFCDLDQVIERVSRPTSKQSMQFTIRSMVERDLIVKKNFERRRHRRRVVLAPTTTGYVEHQRFSPGVVEGLLEAVKAKTDPNPVSAE